VSSRDATSRDAILGAVPANAPKLAVELPRIPLFAKGSRSLLQDFGAALAVMGGKLADTEAGPDLDALVRSLFPAAAVIASATPDLRGTRTLTAAVAPADLADVEVAVVRAAFGVAETGSLWFSEAELQVNALAYLAQHLVALLDPADIVENLHHAYADPRFATAAYCVLMTGPSATADIEGVLIQGAQGVRSLTVIPAPRPRG
jgi:L-lactate dehydrogenase complex protein LldG